MLNNSYNFGIEHSVKIINMQDIIGDLKYSWMLALLLCTSYLLLYVLFNNFITVKQDSKHFWIVKAMHEWAIVPVIFIFIIGLTFFTGYEGI